MERHYSEHPQCYKFWNVDEYIDFFIDILRRLRPDIVLERFAGEAPPRYHAGPCWGLLRNEQLWSMLDKRLSPDRPLSGRALLPLTENKLILYEADVYYV